MTMDGNRNVVYSLILCSGFQGLLNKLDTNSVFIIAFVDFILRSLQLFGQQGLVARYNKDTTPATCIAQACS